ncbi:MAG TPA: sigma-54 dependent transcriptional regulator, partial [Kofleriaceae bacterium]|nr:sigma-54 dependent transcriptional regulator [Kofleriaceae bacterium]
YRRINAYTGWQALEALSKHHVDVVLLDLNLPDTTGFHVLEQIRKERDDIEIIMCTAHSEIRNAVEAVKKGAFDFLVKSYENYQNIHEHIRRALEYRRTKRELLESRTHKNWMREAFHLLENTRSDMLSLVVRLARRVADTPLTVLIEGESGVGKEVLARYIHSRSERADGPFVTVNVSAVPASLLGSYWFGHVKGAFTGADRTNIGKFELADGGTLFLDEVGELDGEAQLKLLRVLQEREIERLGANEPTPVNVRVLAATNKRLHEEVKFGRFREDLYFRLNVLHVTVPPLRDRPEDLPELARLLLRKHAGMMGRGESPGLGVGALDVLRRYDWPGNIRELENLMMRLVALAPRTEIREDDIPPEYWLPTLNQIADDFVARPEGKNLFHLATQQFQRYLIRLMIARSHGNKRLAARALGISYTTLKDKLREAGDTEPEEAEQAALRASQRIPRPSASWPPSDVAGLAGSDSGQVGGNGVQAPRSGGEHEARGLNGDRDTPAGRTAAGQLERDDARAAAESPSSRSGRRGRTTGDD